LYWVKYHLNYLRVWRDAAKSIARATRSIEPDVEVYVIGGAAEDRLTVLSDIDVVLVTKRGFPEARSIHNYLQLTTNDCLGVAGLCSGFHCITTRAIRAPHNPQPPHPP
jgi:hypothetical protein